MLRLTSVIAVGLLSAGMSPTFADQWDKKTVITLTETVLVPHATLTPGKYVIKLVSSDSNRHIVQIFNEREDQVITTILAIPNYRLQPTGDSVFSAWETPAGNPRALRAWFYPGDNFGQEFAYPKGLSAQIARQTQTPVPTATGETVAELKAAPVTKVEPTGEEKAVVAEVKRPEPEPVVAEPATKWAEPEPPAPKAEPTPAPAPAPTPEPTPAPAPAAMPATASPYAFYGLSGLIALGAGLAMRAATSRNRRVS